MSLFIFILSCWLETILVCKALQRLMAPFLHPVGEQGSDPKLIGQSAGDFHIDDSLLPSSSSQVRSNHSERPSIGLTRAHHILLVVIALLLLVQIDSPLAVFTPPC